MSAARARDATHRCELGLLDAHALRQVLQLLFCFLTVLDQGQVMLFELGEETEQLLRIREVQTVVLRA